MVCTLKFGKYTPKVEGFSKDMKRQGTTYNKHIPNHVLPTLINKRKSQNSLQLGAHKGVVYLADTMRRAEILRSFPATRSTEKPPNTNCLHKTLSCSHRTQRNLPQELVL